MKLIRIQRPNGRRQRPWLDVFPPDPRDPDVVRAKALGRAADALTKLLTAHMRHEENAALPLVETYLGREGWAAFGQEIRTTQGGIRGGAQYLPWVLDDASGPTTTKFLRQLPVPARLLYRWVWAPRYRRRNTGT